MKSIILQFSLILIVLFSSQVQILSQLCEPAWPLGPCAYHSVDPPTFVVIPASPPPPTCWYVEFGIQTPDLCSNYILYPRHIIGQIAPGDSCYLISNSQWSYNFTPGITYCWGTHTNGGGSTWNITCYDIQRLPASLPSAALITPVNGAINISLNPLLGWLNIDSASNFKVCIYTDMCCIGKILDSNITSDSFYVPNSRLNWNTHYWWRVKPYGAAGEGPFSDPFSFTTAMPAPPPAPNLTLPPNNSVGLPLADSLRWDISTGASSYWIQVATDGGFNSLIVNDSTITSNSRYVTGLSPLTYYWWRVNAKNAAGTSAFSSAFSFKTMGAPGVPTALAPPNNAIDQPVSLSFQWSRTFDQTLASAAKYWFELYADTTLAALVMDSTLTDTTRAVSGLLNNHNYWWRVKAMNVVGWGLFSSYSKFTTIVAVPPPPSLVSPVNNSVDIPVSLSLVWNKAVNAATYRIQLSTDSLFSSLIVNDSTLTDSTRIVSGLSNLTNYWWRVSAKNAGGISAYSSAFKFTTIIAAPFAPALVSPANNSTGMPVSLSLVWNKALSAISYGLQLSTDSLFNTLIVNDSTLTDTTRSVSGLSNLTNYWWRVNAKNAGGISAYSSAFKFTTIIAASLAPTLVSPANNSVGNLTALTLVWNKSASAVNYRVQLSTDSLFSSLIVNDSTLTDSTKAVSGLNPLTNYWWRVNAKNAGGTSAYSTVYKFRTLGVPAQITGIFIPANGSVNQPVTINFMWSRAFDQTMRKSNNMPTKFNSLSISNYWYEITSDSVSLAGIIRDSTLTDTNKTQGGFNYSASYYWRVKAKNQIGWGSFSFWQKFTTAEPLPATVTLKVIPGGFYNPLTGALRMRDTLWVYLVDSATCLRVDSNKVVLDSITFSTSLSFSNAATGNYYLYVYHRNHLPVASRIMQSIIRGSNVSYDLTTDSAKAYGFNMVKVSASPALWGMIPGDANRDEFVDGLDQPIWMNQNGLTGYLSADFNGDGFVDGLDQTMWIEYNGLSSYLPCITPFIELSSEKLRIIFEKSNYMNRKTNQINNIQK